jgi:hypothetical protein
MFLLYHSDRCNTSEMVIHWCYVNDLHTTHAVVCWVTTSFPWSTWGRGCHRHGQGSGRLCCYNLRWSWSIESKGAGPREWLGKADVLPWHAAPSMLILAGKQQLPCSFMQARQERSLPCRVMSHRTHWETQEEGMMSTTASFPSVWNQSLIDW